MTMIWKKNINQLSYWRKELQYKENLYNGNGMQNFERARNWILYSQNRYQNYDLDIEYTDSIKMEKSDLSFDDDIDEFYK